MVTKKMIISERSAHYPNEVTDYFGRNQAVWAYLFETGMYKAFSVDAETGKLIYDERKDPTLYSDGKITEAGKAIKNKRIEALLWNYSKDQILNDDGTLKMALSMQEINSLKNIGDKYIVGAYDDQTRNALMNWAVGRAFSKFNTFIWSRLANLVQRGKLVDTGAFLKAYQNEDGSWYAAQERVFVEGQLYTMYLISTMIFKGMSINTISKELNDTQKRNLYKILSQTIVFLSGLIVYALLADLSIGDDRKERRKKIKGANMFAKSLLQTLQEIYTIGPTLSDMIESPFFLTGFIKQLLDLNLGEDQGLLLQLGDNMWNKTGFGRTYKNIRDLIITE